MTMVIGVFDELRQAQDAQARLQHEAQFSPGQVHLANGHVNFAGDIVADPEPAAAKGRNLGVLASIGGFWANLIQSNTHSDVLSDALQRGHVILVAQVNSAEQNQQAADVLLACGALVVEHGVQQDPSLAQREPQPWHEADERSAEGTRGRTGRNEPLGTHSLTGSSASVGLPGGAAPDSGASERTRAPERMAEHGTAAAAEPRAGAADLLGRKPDVERDR